MLRTNCWAQGTSEPLPEAGKNGVSEPPRETVRQGDITSNVEARASQAITSRLIYKSTVILHLLSEQQLIWKDSVLLASGLKQIGDIKKIL